MDQKHLSYNLWTLSLQFGPKILISALFGPEIKVHRSSEVSGYTEINKKVLTYIQLTSKMDQKHLNYNVRTLSRQFGPKILISALFWPEMKVHRSSEVRG